MLNGFFETVECEIVVSHTDRRESFCQRCNVLLRCQLPKLLKTISSSRLVAFTGIGGGHQANVQRNRRKRETLYVGVVIFLLEVQESVVESRLRIIPIQVKRVFEMLCGCSII